MPRLPSLHLLLPVAVAAASLTACAKKDESPSPAPVQNVASYTLDGQARTCIATQTIYHQPGQLPDSLVVNMVTTPQPNSGPEHLTFAFKLVGGNTTSSYQPYVGGLVFYGQAYPRGLVLPYTTSTRTFENSGGSALFPGGITGTFSGEARTYAAGSTTSYAVSHTLTSGTFTNVQP